MAYRKKKLTDEDIAKLHIKEVPTQNIKDALVFIEKLRTWRSVDKLRSTYFEGVKKSLVNTKNNRIYFDYRIEGTVTGRLSCGSYKAKEERLGVSFHTLPRDKKDSANIREVCIVPDPNIFVTADFSTMELRVLAHVANEINMIRAFESGADLHTYTASLIYEKDIADVTREERQIAKSVSFLVVYGGGAWKLSRTANVSLKVAEQTIAKFQEVYPRVFTWMDEVKDKVYKEHYITSMFGRRRNLPDIISNVQQVRDTCIRQAINFVIQSSASDITCYAVLDIAEELKARNMDSSLIGTVHDSIEVEVVPHELEEVLQIMHYKMVNYPRLRKAGYSLKVPIAIEIEVGKSFSGGEKVEFDNKSRILNREILNGWLG